MEKTEDRSLSGACTPARDEKRECPRDKERGIAEGEKLRFTDRRTVTKREWSLRERRKLAEERSGISGGFFAFSFLYSSFAARLISSFFYPL